MEEKRDEFTSRGAEKIVLRKKYELYRAETEKYLLAACLFRFLLILDDIGYGVERRNNSVSKGAHSKKKSEARDFAEERTQRAVDHGGGLGHSGKGKMPHNTPRTREVLLCCEGFDALASSGSEGGSWHGFAIFEFQGRKASDL